MVCVYCVSHVSALLTLEIKGYAGQNAKLLLGLTILNRVRRALAEAPTQK